MSLILRTCSLFCKCMLGLRLVRLLLCSALLFLVFCGVGVALLRLGLLRGCLVIVVLLSRCVGFWIGFCLVLGYWVSWQLVFWCLYTLGLARACVFRNSDATHPRCARNAYWAQTQIWDYIRQYLNLNDQKKEFFFQQNSPHSFWVIQEQARALVPCALPLFCILIRVRAILLSVSGWAVIRWETFIFILSPSFVIVRA